ncbi:MAG: ABC transporter ATP-binding protein [Treponema sp.]|nr:ABC transporter ATP-binding protein [Treponema sp.]
MGFTESGIVAENLSLGYGGKPVIRGLNVAIPKGAVTVIIGANGCGKSTLLKGIARILKPEAGSVRLDGRDIHASPSREIARRLAVLPQSPRAPEGMTVEELAAYGRFPHKSGFGTLGREDFEIIRESLRIAGIEDYRGRPLSDLSGGQRQRAWIAMTLCQKTEFMLLDEPTTYLDMAHQMEILTLLSVLNRREGRTIVMVLHELNNASRFADHILAMKDGFLLAEGPPEGVVTRENLREIYRIEAELAADSKTGKPICLSYENCGGEQ